MARLVITPIIIRGSDHGALSITRVNQSAVLASDYNCVLSSVCALGDSGKVTTVVATPGQGPDRPQEVSYTDIKVIGNGSFGVVYQARLSDTQEMVAIKKVLQDKRFKVRIMMKALRMVTTRPFLPDI